MPTDVDVFDVAGVVAVALRVVILQNYVFDCVRLSTMMVMIYVSICCRMV